MSPFAGILLLAGLGAGLALSGSWLAAFLEEASPAERLAVSPLAGLASVLLLVSLINLFFPLALPWAAFGLLPLIVSLAWPRSRQRLWSDVRAIVRQRRFWLAGVLGAAFICLQLGPALVHGWIVLYDGTSNHDTFFWVIGADYLRHHTYFEAPMHSARHPVDDFVRAIIGWKPNWGRMGAEGGLALASTLTFTPAVKIYLYATASLFLPWVAAVGLAVRTFFTPRLTPGALAALVFAQPVFIYFCANASLPNFLAAMMGATVVIATERALRARTEARPFGTLAGWWLLLALSFHALCCTYPEMLPFILFPAGLLWMRHGFVPGRSFAARRAGGVAAAFLAGTLLNPVTTVRAVSGFLSSLATARADAFWANIFAPLSPGQYVPALGTLSIPAVQFLGPWTGVLLTALLLLCAGLAIQRAVDPVGAAITYAGGGALLLYTILADFLYGWQKSAQFTAVFIAAALPVAILDALARERRDGGWRGALAGMGALAISTFTLFAAAMNWREVYKWSGRKVVSQDWFALRDFARASLAREPVLVDGASFRMAFYYGMWATYFLPDSELYFAGHHPDSGGYLRPYVLDEESLGARPPRAILVSRAWADAFDIDSPRFMTGREFVLLRAANRVLDLSGVLPANGPPESAAARFRIDVKPLAPSVLRLELRDDRAEHPSPVRWQALREAPGAPPAAVTVAGPPPWIFEVPLVAGQINRIDFVSDDGAAAPTDHPYDIVSLRVTNAR